MKKFINEHPKLYWMIVGVIAALVFGIVTAVGCAKLERAEAAEDVFPALSELPFANQKNWNDHLNDSDYLVIYSCILNGNCPGRQYIFFDDMPEFVLDDKGILIKYNSMDMYGGYMWTDGKFHSSGAGNNVVPGQIYVHYFDTSKNISLYATNFPLPSDLSEYPQRNIDGYYIHSVPVTKTYLVNAPYAVIDDYENYNVFLEYPRGEIDMSEFKVEFSLGGQPMNPENGYKMEYTLYVWLPSADYIRSKYGLLMEQDFLQNVLLSQDCYDADVLEWQKKIGTNGDSVLYKIPLTYEFYNNPETGESGHYRIKFDYKDLLDNMEYKLGDGETDFSFREYYGRSESEWIGWVRKMVFGHALISRMDALVYTQIDDVDTYYGRTTTFTFLRNGNFVYSEVNKDALNEDINSDMSDGINNALQEGLIQSGDKVDELQQNINNVSGSLGSFDTEFEGVDLWNGIKGFGSGLIGLTGFLGNIATALGSVFVFMPYDVRQLVGYFFMASLVVALWKLIKR